MRYNGSNLDTYITEKGVEFKNIPEVVDNGFHEIYTNTGADDGTRIAKLMKYMANTKGECAEFPRISKRVKYFKEEQEGVQSMCEAVEQYARERAEKAAREAAKEAAKAARENAEKNVRNFFRNGVSIEVVASSIIDLPEERIRQIYEEVMSEGLVKVK